MLKKIRRILKKKLVKVVKEKVIIPYIIGHYLDNRTALITGGSSGIGYAIAESFINNGACVIISGRSLEKLENAKRKLLHECRCNQEKIILFPLDISKTHTINKQLDSLVCGLSQNIDILVNNAGINCGSVFPETSEEDYDRILDTNLKGMYFISQYIAKYMVRKNIKGNILNVTSSSALRPAISPYIIAKWGERGLTLGLAKKYLPYGIIVNGIAPGPTLTPILSTEERTNMQLEYSPSKRYVATEEIGNIATLLVSDIGRMIVGDTVYATGGAGLITFDDMQY